MFPFPTLKVDSGSAGGIKGGPWKTLQNILNIIFSFKCCHTETEDCIAI